MAEKHLNPLSPALPAPGANARWNGLHGCSPALVFARAAAIHSGLLVVVTAGEQQAYRLEEQLHFFARDDIPVWHFPDWETLPYDVFSPQAEVISQRLAVLHQLPRRQRGILIVSADSLLEPVPPASFLDGRVLLLQRGERLDPLVMRTQMEAAGYAAVSEVREHGEYALRGSVLDLYPMGAQQPYRLDLFDDEIESIRCFDPDTQRSTDKLEAVRMLPAREFPLDEDGITTFRQNYRQVFEGDPSESLIYQEISRGIPPGGIEYYLSLFFEQTGTLFDYLPDSALIMQLGDVDESQQTAWEQIQQRYEQRRVDPRRPLLPPEQAFVPLQQIQQQLQSRCGAVIAETTQQATRFTTRELPTLAGADPDKTAVNLQAFLDEFSGRVLLIADSAGRRESLRDWLRTLDLRPERIESWQAFVTGGQTLGVMAGGIDHGCILPDDGIAIISESQLSGGRPATRRRRSTHDAATVIRDLANLAVGAPVVHADHGVGRYQGLKKLAAGQVQTEFLALEYAGGDKLYVPVSSLHLIHRFTGADADTAPLHKLGNDRWSKARKRAAKRAHDVAAELLEIQARRASAPGIAIVTEQEDYRRFCADFPFTETHDQARAIDEVLADLAKPNPMDRVVCGDVGFGKTEVALRSAFAAVQAGYQVCILVPTTLLAQQHYQTFADRFADWPVNVGTLSRLRSKKEQDKLLKELAAGTADIVVGTHRLLRADIKFKRLGLLVVDEEQRFGVRHKERIKSMRAAVDMLTLTATPIPRTLNMSMTGLRDLSIIATPPEQRLPIQSFVSRRSATLVEEACRRELRRGGQIYYLHNEVRDIERIARELADIVPEARIRIAHGQMRERDLEQVMIDFYHHRFDILLCTTIIESGIDVPAANTMIIERADKFGLAQLHQLRGRVGRSHHRAYAYLLTPPDEVMTPDARKRMDAIASLDDLGAGFTLATHDLEIRGAGELLGDAQSGQINEVGFDLYRQLLDRAVAAHKRGELPNPDAELAHATEVDLSDAALLPEDYIPDVHMRLVLYKRISAAADQQQLRELKIELIDRFGLLPPATENLFDVTAVKLLATPLGIAKIEAGPDAGRLQFGATTNIDPGALISLVQSNPRAYRLKGDQQLTFHRNMPDVAARVDTLQDLLGQLRTTPQAKNQARQAEPA